ncbi:hypothetical protein [Butyrivibrio sp. INlla18]|uniref:hypothetical protein n=1 Tax=Butyrivibrio sp. INlla18 TaxID=1520806 RepID=UPI0015A0ECC8|nr:hypothetical protein [Butyrivibrio sp. INlla18]
MPAPESLAIEEKKKNGKYNLPDVVDRLRSDFNNKCYLCETKGLQDPEVEHLLPHCNRKYLERVFDWDNLFWSCKHCNDVKNQEEYSNGIIDCCKNDPEELLLFLYKDNDIAIIPKDEENRLAVITSKLLNEIYNLKNTGIRIAACEVRKDGVAMQMNQLYKAITKYRKNPNSKLNSRMLKVLLNTESEYAAFKRSYIRENKDLYPDVYGLIDEE